MLRMCLRTLAIATVLLPPSVLMASPAHAVDTAVTSGSVGALDTSCARGDLCFWVNDHKGGPKGRVSGNNTTWNWNQPACPNGTWNNCASSIQNNGNTCDVTVYKETGYHGASLKIRRGDYLADLSGYWITFPFDSWDDDIQSNKWC